MYALIEYWRRRQKSNAFLEQKNRYQGMRSTMFSRRACRSTIFSTISYKLCMHSRVQPIYFSGMKRINLSGDWLRKYEPDAQLHAYIYNVVYHELD